MKNKYLLFLFAVAIVGFSSCSASRNGNSQYSQNYDRDEQRIAYDQGEQQITYDQFHSNLSPYGNWINYGGYGNVWVPFETGFRPYYTNGYWRYTQLGWTWISNYNWGWAPFHYGRWVNDMAYGWMWVPGYEWSPAWVSWRGGGDYYGWAPLGPGMNNSASFGNIPYNNYCFVNRRYINSPRVYNYYVSPRENVNIINNTTIINNKTVIRNKEVYVSGPSVNEVERFTNSKIIPASIVSRRSPGNTEVSRGEVTIYRPQVKEVNVADENVKTIQSARSARGVLRQSEIVNPQNNESAREINGIEAERQPVNRPIRQAEPVRENPVRQGNDQNVPAQPAHQRFPSPTREGNDFLPAENAPRVRLERPVREAPVERNYNQQREQPVRQVRENRVRNENRSYNENRQVRREARPVRVAPVQQEREVRPVAIPQDKKDD